MAAGDSGEGAPVQPLYGTRTRHSHDQSGYRTGDEGSPHGKMAGRGRRVLDRIEQGRVTLEYLMRYSELYT